MHLNLFCWNKIESFSVCLLQYIASYLMLSAENLPGSNVLNHFFKGKKPSNSIVGTQYCLKKSIEALIFKG